MIEGEKINLVAVSMDYLPVYQKWINDPEVSDKLGVLWFPFNMEKEREWVERNAAPDDWRKTFTILTKNGKPIGNISLMDIDFTHRAATLGIMIGEKDYWDRGYGSDAINTLLDFSFNMLGLHRIELRTLVLNKRAIECYKKCGFKIEGKKRKHWFYEGKYYDDLLMSILREDWDRLKKK